MSHFFIAQYGSIDQCVPYCYDLINIYDYCILKAGYSDDIEQTMVNESNQYQMPCVAKLIIKNVSSSSNYHELFQFYSDGVSNDFFTCTDSKLGKFKLIGNNDLDDMMGYIQKYHDNLHSNDVTKLDNNIVTDFDFIDR